MRAALLTSSVVLSLVALACGNTDGLSSPSGPFPPFDPGTVTGGSGPGGGPFGTYDQPVIVPSRPTPALSGGTLLLIAQGHKAAVADPERDHVTFVDLDHLVVSSTASLQKGDEPGRLAEDGRGFVHVVLRGSGAVATLDPATGAEIGRQAVCANPRGIAYDAKTDAVHVACVEGELVTLPAAGGNALRQVKLDRDLRDVVVDGERLLVSRFRAAELLVVETDGTVSRRLTPAGVARNPSIPPNAPPDLPGNASFSPAVAWRTVAAPGGGAIMMFQEEQTSEVQIQQGGYGGPCGGIVRGGASVLHADGTVITTTNTGAVLPVDVAPTADGSQLAIASAGSVSISGFRTTPPIVSIPSPPAGGGVEQPCGPPPGQVVSEPSGQVVALAYDPSQRLVVQTRDPLLVVGDRAIVLPGDVIRDTGQEIFHFGTGGNVACASCHPEGHDDGHVWTFASLGARRTQSLAGGALGTGPFHWSGDMRDLFMLSSEVFQKRMSGPALLGEHVQALEGWIDKVPGYKPVAPADAAAADRGRALFQDATVGCSSCHGGPAMTTHAIVEVGTGSPFKVPSLLGVGFRAPFMHDGCAPALADRFGPCGGSDDRHGHVSSLTDAERADLVEYLGTL